MDAVKSGGRSKKGLFTYSGYNLKEGDEAHVGLLDKGQKKRGFPHCLGMGSSAEGR